MDVLLQPEHLIPAGISIMGGQGDPINDVPNMLGDEKGVWIVVKVMMMKMKYQIRIEN